MASRTASKTARLEPYLDALRQAHTAEGLKTAYLAATTVCSDLNPGLRLRSRIDQATALSPGFDACLNGMRQAQTPDEMEAAFQGLHRIMGGLSRILNERIEKVRISSGRLLCDRHPHGHFVPRFGPGRQLSVCGETYRVGKGGNSTGFRYCWTYAQNWAIETMVREGLSWNASHLVWEWWSQWPHRALRTVEQGLAGKLPDPELDVLIPHQRHGHGSPIRYSVEENQRDGTDRRASRPCPCGGTLFDWGGGSSRGFHFINWHCIACPDVFTEHMTAERFYRLRNPASRQAA